MNQQNNNNKQKKMFFVITAVAVVIVVCIIIYIIRSAGRVTTDDAYIEGRIHTIAPKVPGTVIDVNVHDNQFVRAGDILLKLDPKDYELRVNQAQADLNSEKQRLFDYEAGIKVAAANLEVQQVSFQQADRDKKRADVLFQKNAIPQEQYEKFTTSFDMSAANVKAAKEQLEKAKSQKALQEEVIKQKEAALNIAELNLSYTTIYAPVNGQVTKKTVQIGNQLQPSQPLMAVVDINDIWLVANLKETELKKVKPGQTVHVKVDTYPDNEFTGTVNSIMAGTGAAFSLFPPENALGNYVKIVQRIPVKILFDKKSIESHALRVGMSCQPVIYTRN